MHRKIKGKIKTLPIKKYPSEKWFACFSVEEYAKGKLQRAERKVGIDVGIKHFLTDSDRRQIENPRFYEKSLKRIRIEHKKLSKKKKGSRNREKQKIRLSRTYETMVNQRNDFLHKLSRFYVNNYDLIVVESLNICGMVRNRRLAGKILDASWSIFIKMLEYKAESADAQVVKANPRNTSKIHKYGLLDRDYNASLNILESGLSGMGQPSEPVEIEPLRVIPASSIVEAGSPHHL